MQLIIIIGIILITVVFILNGSNKKNSNNNEIKSKKINFKKILYAILLFIPICMIYYFLIALIPAIPLFFVEGAESGVWAYAIILGLIGSPILTIITIVKIVFKK